MISVQMLYIFCENLIKVRDLSLSFFAFLLTLERVLEHPVRFIWINYICLCHIDHQKYLFPKFPRFREKMAPFCRSQYFLGKRRRFWSRTATILPNADDYFITPIYQLKVPFNGKNIVKFYWKRLDFVKRGL